MGKPTSMRHLNAALRRFCDVNEQDFLSIRAVVANAVVSQMLPDGAVKGGSALIIRFGDDATRATTDLDAAGALEPADFIEKFEELLSRGWNGFTARLVEREPAAPVGVPRHYVMQPFDVKLSYLGTPWLTVRFELGHNEVGDADAPEMVLPFEADRLLQAMGFPGLAPVPLMPLAHQVAQKIHAASEPNSSRAHDLIDLQVIVQRSGLDLLVTREICVRLFAYRRGHAWPPKIKLNEGWSSLYAAQSDGLAVLPGAEDAVTWANELIQKIDGSAD